MRFLSFLLIISVSQFMNAQNVFTTYTDTVVYDEFIYDQKNFPQKYNTLELSTIDNGYYRIKRLSNDGKSVVFLNTDKIYDNFSLIVDLEIPKTKVKSSGGLILHGQTNRNGAIFIELNDNKEYRVIKQSGDNLRLLSGMPKHNGWQKSKSISKTGTNTISVTTKDGTVDIYINNDYITSCFDMELVQGKIGLFSASQSEVLIDRFILIENKQKLSKPVRMDEEVYGDREETNDPSFEEVILIFKTKIDKQQLEITRLNKDLERCRTKLNYDTTLIKKASTMEKANRTLSSRIDSTSKALLKAQKRLEYLESFKEDIENGSNGDLVLSLTSILAEVKKENQKLKNESVTNELKNMELKKENQILLREVERYKYLLNLKEE